MKQNGDATHEAELSLLVRFPVHTEIDWIYLESKTQYSLIEGHACRKVTSEEKIEAHGNFLTFAQSHLMSLYTHGVFVLWTFRLFQA